MGRAIGVLGVPSSAGAHWPGQEKAPRAIRAADLVGALQRGGVDVIDCGDLPIERFRPDPNHPSGRNVEAVVRVAREVDVRVDAVLSSGLLPLVIGGDCTISLGVMSAVTRQHPTAGLVYFDGHPDLNTPLTTKSGIFDGMGLAHLVGEFGALDRLAAIGERMPIVSSDRVVLFGVNPSALDLAEHEAMERHAFSTFDVDHVRREPELAAERALALLRAPSPFAVHFDVDVVDFSDLPLANVAQFGGALPFADAMRALRHFIAQPSLAALTVTEVNPDHDDEEGSAIERLVAALATAFSLRVEQGESRRRTAVHNFSSPSR